MTEQYLLLIIHVQTFPTKTNKLSIRQITGRRNCHRNCVISAKVSESWRCDFTKKGQAFTTVAFLIYLQMTWGGLKVESWKGMRGSQSPVGEAVKSHRCNVWCDTELPAPPGLTVTVTSTKFFLTNYHTFTGQSQTVFLREKAIFLFIFFIYMFLAWYDHQIATLCVVLSFVGFCLFCCVSIGSLFIPAS